MNIDKTIEKTTALTGETQKNIQKHNAKERERLLLDYLRGLGECWEMASDK